MILKQLFSRLFQVLIFLILGVTPLLQAQNRYGYEYPKVLFFICLEIGMLLGLQFSPKQITEKFFSKSFFTITGLLFLVSLSISSLFMQQPLQGIFGQYPYYQGIILYVFLFLFALFVRNVPITLKKYSLVFVISACWIGVVAIGQWIGIHLFHLPIATYSGRVVSTFGQPNLYSGYLAMVLPFFLVFLDSLKGKKKTFAGVLIGIVIVGIMVSMSRLALGMVGMLGIISAYVYLKKTQYFLPIFIPLCMGVLVLSVLTLPKLIQSELIDPFNFAWLRDNNPEKRVYIWQVALSQGLKRPLFGYGVDSFKEVYSAYFTTAPKEASYYSRKVLVVDRAHNYILDLFVYAGLVGVLLWVFLVGKTAWGLRKQRWLVVSLMLYVLFVLVHPQSVIHLLFFWFLAGWSSKSST